jgi:hypothetical protein
MNDQMGIHRTHSMLIFPYRNMILGLNRTEAYNYSSAMAPFLD